MALKLVGTRSKILQLQRLTVCFEIHPIDPAYYIEDSQIFRMTVLCLCPCLLHVPPVLKMQLMIKVTTRLMAFLPLLNQALTIVGQARLAQLGPLGTAAAGTSLDRPDLSS